MDKKKEHSIGGLDESLLEEFELELAEEEKSRKTRITVVMTGLVIGVLVGLYIAFSGVDRGGKEIATQARVIANESDVAPEPVPVLVDVTEVTNSQEEEALKPSKSGEPDEAEFKAPDILITDKPMEVSSKTKEKDFTFEAMPEDEDFDNPMRDIHKDVDKKKVKAKQSDKKKVSPGEVIEKVEPATKPPEEAPAKVVKKAPLKPAKKSPTKRSRYAVRVSATTDGVEALKVRDTLLKQGFEAWISQGKVRQKIFRVVAGEFASIKEASALSARLAKDGFKPRTSRIQKESKVSLVVGEYKTTQQAGKIAKLMEKMGYSSTVKSSGGAIDLFVVLVGRYNSIDQARQMEKKIATGGQRTMGVAKAN